MLNSLGRRLRGADREANEQSGAGTGDLAAAIEAATEENRRSRSIERERELLKLRHRLGARLVGEHREKPDDRESPFPPLDPSGLAVAPADAIDGPTLRGGIRRHGYVLVRNLIDRDVALGLADRIEAAFKARESRVGGDGLYEEFVPEPPYPEVSGRSWITAGGGLLAADSPSILFDVIETFERIGLRRVITDFLGEPATISVEKSTLRRADPGPPGGWHQDGSFMGNTRALNVWVSLSACGVDAPGLEFVPRRIDQLVDTGGEGSGAEHLDTPDDDEVTAKTVLVAPGTAEAAAGGGGVMNPRFEPGDVMLFDDLFLHRTGSDPSMPNSRYAIESWFFGASGFPRDYVPLAF